MGKKAHSTLKMEIHYSLFTLKNQFVPRDLKNDFVLERNIFSQEKILKYYLDENSVGCIFNYSL